MSIDVKICGLKDEAGINSAIQGGAHYIGFVFHPTSRHFIDPGRAHLLSRHVPSSIKKVGLIVDATNEDINKIIETIGLDLIQLHGHETPERVVDIKNLTGLPVMKAIRIAKEDHLNGVNDFESVADKLLFDTRLEHGPMGGTGHSFDWKILQNKHFKKPWMLAGGLNIKNLQEAIRVSGTKAVDVSTGVEDDLGQKNPYKIKEFLNFAAQF